MFPRLKDRIGTALDILVEFSTLGEYRLDASSAPGVASAIVAAVPEPAPRRGGIGSSLTDVAVERIVAGGAVASKSIASRTPAATPAARRPASPPCDAHPLADALQRRLERPSTSQARRRGEQGSTLRDAGTARRVRAGTPPSGEQLCFADV